MKQTLVKPIKPISTYHRRQSVVVDIGGVAMGGDYPIRLQSMTTSDTTDIDSTVAQIRSLWSCGADYVRLTVPNAKAVQALARIKDKLNAQKQHIPLIADVHFTPSVAQNLAPIVEKVRINPGNYADSKRFRKHTYSNKSYADELKRIRDTFLPLIGACQKHQTALRIGTNHGSLSDRILNRYGDTPLGMVESALEFVRICAQENFNQIVLSMKASNPLVMVEAYRLLVKHLDQENLLPYPLHLGLTEAGNKQDGRIKSAIGIGTLLAEGLGDTIRVSLTEAPENELPVAKKLVQYIPQPNNLSKPIHTQHTQHTPRKQVLDFGNNQSPRVMVDLSYVKPRQQTMPQDIAKLLDYHYLSDIDKWHLGDRACDYVYVGQTNISHLPRGLKQVIDYQAWLEHKQGYPLIDMQKLRVYTKHIKHLEGYFVAVPLEQLNQDSIALLGAHPKAIIVLRSQTPSYLVLKQACVLLANAGVQNPICLWVQYAKSIPQDDLLVRASVDVGALALQKLIDGICITYPNAKQKQTAFLHHLMFDILQGARQRMSKTEYIACPSCGRTFFDLEETTEKIKAKTAHLKELKIGIMGCIVNGPGEMADADYGYVGAGKNKITLYKGQKIIKTAIPAENAVNELIQIIKDDNKWKEPN